VAEERVQRRLVAILAADVVGYSRLIRADEEATLAALKGIRKDVIDPKIAEHHGRIVKLMGDGMLAEFGSAVDAVRNAVEVQQAVTEHQADVPDDRRIQYRVGVNLGDVVIDGDDIYGDGVNVAARLEGLAAPGSVCISGAVHEQVRDRIDVPFEDLGDQEVKNIDRPIRVWRWSKHPIETTEKPIKASEPLPLPDKPSIAVLPFEDLSADKDQEYFADGIAEDIITALSRNRGVFVIARNSSFTYKGAAVDVKRVSQELGVRYVLKGSVRKAGSRVRLTAQLVDAATGRHVWAERYDRDLADIFAIQDEITQNIAAALGAELASAEMQRARRKDPGSLDAWDCTMRATWHLARVTREDMKEARRFALRAIELDPGAAAAFGILAHTHMRDVVNGWSKSTDRSISEAYEAARKAVALDDRDVNAYRALGMANLVRRRFEDAFSSFETAVDLDPNNAAAQGALASVLAVTGRRDEAVARVATAMRLSPRDPFRYLWLLWRGEAEFAQEQYGEAVESALKTLQINPDFPGGLRLLASTYGVTGRIDEARAALDEYLRLVPGMTATTIRSQVLFERPEVMDRFMDGLRMAGLPE
jgi:TolB-like protein/class 3 adenylate cyclase/Tfp pilus assembly protein PilF